MAKENNLAVDCGATFTADFNATDVEGGAPLDFTGSTLRCALKRTMSDVTPALLLSNGAEGGLSHNGTGGTVSLVITDERSALLSGEYFYDLYCVFANGTAQRLSQGMVIVSPRVTT